MDSGVKIRRGVSGTRRWNGRKDKEKSVKGKVPEKETSKEGLWV